MKEDICKILLCVELWFYYISWMIIVFGNEKEGISNVDGFGWRRI